MERMSPQEIQAAIDGGYRAAGNIFRGFVDALEARYGKEEAAAIARQAVRCKGQAAGELAARRFGRGGFAELAAAHRAGYPSTRVLELSATRYVARDDHCPVVQGWRQSGLGEERIRELADLYCWGDLHFARAFNPRINLEFQSRIGEGHPYCQWLFTLGPPLEGADAGANLTGEES